MIWVVYILYFGVKSPPHVTSYLLAIGKSVMLAIAHLPGAGKIVLGAVKSRVVAVQMGR